MDFRLWLEDSRQTVKQLFEKGIDRRNPSILGYHGTSIQTIRSLMAKGFLPVAKGLMRVFGNEKDTHYGIHVSPNMENAVVKTMQFRNPPEPDAYKDAMSWARHISERHALMDRYNMDMDKASHHRGADDMMMGQMVTGKSQQSIIKRLRLDPDPREAITAGVVLSISDKVSERFRLLVGGDGNDINIITNALPIDCILGIDPADDAAYRWLDEL